MIPIAMQQQLPTSEHRSPVIRWVLRSTVIAMCIGQAWWLAVVKETPLVSWLHSPRDVGGLDLSETFALRTQTVLAALSIIAAAVTCFRSLAPLLWLVSLVQLLIAVAMWQTQSGFQLVSSWLPIWLAELLPFATQAGRFSAPLALWLYERRDRDSFPNWETVARWGTALAFFGHGLEALWLSPKFVDLILFSAFRWEMDITEAAATGLLTGIGVIDLLLAALIVGRRWRAVAIYAAIWGLVTAFSRITAYGLDFGWYQTLIRAAHFGLPAALAIYWWQRSRRVPTPTDYSPTEQ